MLFAKRLRSSEVEPRQVASSISVYNVYINMYRCVCVCVHVATISKVSEIAKMHFFAKADPPSDIIIGNLQCSCLFVLVGLVSFTTTTAVQALQHHGRCKQLYLQRIYQGVKVNTSQDCLCFSL